MVSAIQIRGFGSFSLQLSEPLELVRKTLKLAESVELECKLLYLIFKPGKEWREFGNLALIRDKMN